MFRAVSKIRSVGRVGAAKSGATCSRGFSAGMWQGASDPNKRSASASSSSPSFSSSTHQVFNQSKPFVEVDLFSSDRPLQRAVTGLTSFAHQRDKDTAMHVLQQHGVSSGKLNIMESAEHAEANIPKLDSFDQCVHQLFACLLACLFVSFNVPFRAVYDV